MTEIMESITVDMILTHTDKCPLCETQPEPPQKTSNIVPSPNDDQFVGDHAAIGNDSGDLDANMKGAGRPRPQDWLLDFEGEKDHCVTPNPHHLIPGNESLKKSQKILAWIFASKGKIAADIGYDVNNAANGKWLPSNNAMRGRWTTRTTDNKLEYVIAAMERANAHFHDRHNSPYSMFVEQVLNKIADRMNGIEALDSGCPFVTDKQDGKYKPPYWLYKRLNGLSERLAGHLLATAQPNRQLYTSKYVLLYWNKKKGTSPGG